jgi:hypothetical protein
MIILNASSKKEIVGHVSPTRSAEEDAEPTHGAGEMGAILKSSSGINTQVVPSPNNPAFIKFTSSIQSFGNPYSDIKVGGKVIEKSRQGIRIVNVPIDTNSLDGLSSHAQTLKKN